MAALKLNAGRLFIAFLRCLGQMISRIILIARHWNNQGPLHYSCSRETNYLVLWPQQPQQHDAKT